MVSLTAKKVLGSNTLTAGGLSVWPLDVFSMLAWVSFGHSCFLPQPREMQIWSAGYSKFPTGAKCERLLMNDCVSPVIV